jgi:heterodisulfide reductase subunit A-like polyferredoxin
LIESEFTIIGGGPGGIAAAIEAAKAGVNVTLLDENERLGGQIYRQLEKGFKVTDPPACLASIMRKVWNCWVSSIP